jgi:hypothetical protein
MRTPEQRLMNAVLEDAMDVYRHPRANRRRLVHETEAWFRSDDPSYLFSFARICKTLRLDPRAIRAALEQERLGHMLAA